MHSAPNAKRARVSKLKARRIGVGAAFASTRLLRCSHTTPATTTSATARPRYVLTTTWVWGLRNASRAAPNKVLTSTVAREPRIRMEPTYGNMVVPSELTACANVRRQSALGAVSRMEPTYGNIVVPSELKACAKVRRLLAVRAGPSMEISGFATT